MSVLLLTLGCEKQIPTPELESQRMLYISGEMSQSTPNTRLELDWSEGVAMNLKWQTTDKLHLVFVQNNTKIIVPNVPITSVSTDGRSGYFTVEVPTQIITSQSYNLYGYFGEYTTVNNIPSVSINNDNKVVVRLPERLSFIRARTGEGANFKDYSTLWYYQNNSHLVAMRFHVAVPANATNISANMEHLGALFHIVYTNHGTNGTTYFPRLTALNGEKGWAYNNGTVGQDYFNANYDLENGVPLINPTTQTAPYIQFGAVDPLTNGGSTHIWAWYPFFDNVTFPALVFQRSGYIDYPSYAVKTNSANTMPARTTPLQKGKVYTFYVACYKDGVNDPPQKPSSWLTDNMYFTDRFGNHLNTPWTPWDF